MFRWYTLQTYSGHENKAKQNLAQRADNFNLARSFRQLVIPMETIHEVKDGQKITSEKRMMPGYLFIEMELNEESWQLVKNTPSIVGFIGGDDPVPLTRVEVDRLFGRSGTTTTARVTRAPAYNLGESVKVTAGPMAEFAGEITEINTDAQRLRILVSIFGRETPVEVGFDQVQKVS